MDVFCPTVEGMTPPMANTREAPVFQLVRSNQEQAQQGHERLRGDWRKHEERLIKLENAVSEHGFTIKLLQTASPDLSKTKLSAGTVVTIVFAVVGIIAGQLASTWGVKSDIRDMNTQLNLLQKLQDERSVTLNNKTDAIDKKQEMLRIKFDDLSKEFDRRFQKPR